MLPTAVSPYLGPASSLLSRLDAAFCRIKGLENVIVLDERPAAESNHLVSSGAVYTALQGKADLVDGVVPASQLPSYVDDIVEVDELPVTGDSGKIYVRNGEAYRWTGSRFLQMGVQSDWNATDSDDPAYILHKPDIATMIANACRFLYTKPAGGIPKTDLASGVQAVLDDALTLSEVESGFSKWTWSDGVERGQPQFRHEDPLSSWSFYSVVSGADWYLAEESFTGNETQLIFTNPETGVEVVATRTKIGQTVDAALSDTSENPVQNKTIKAALDTKASMTDMAARLTRTEAVAGYTEWVWEDGEDRGQPVFDEDYWFVSTDGSLWTYWDATGDETRLFFYDDLDNEIVATRTKIRPTKTSELQNDSNFLTQHQSLAGYARTSDIPSLAGYARMSDIPYKLVDMSANIASFVSYNGYLDRIVLTLQDRAVNKVTVPVLYGNRWHWREAGTTGDNGDFYLTFHEEPVLDTGSNTMTALGQTLGYDSEKGCWVATNNELTNMDFEIFGVDEWYFSPLFNAIMIPSGNTFDCLLLLNFEFENTASGATPAVPSLSIVPMDFGDSKIYMKDGAEYPDLSDITVTPAVGKYHCFGFTSMSSDSYMQDIIMSHCIVKEAV